MMKKNLINNGERIITKDHSKVKVFVIPTNEELVIALDTAQIVTETRSQVIQQ